MTPFFTPTPGPRKLPYVAVAAQVGYRRALPILLETVREAARKSSRLNR